MRLAVFLRAVNVGGHRTFSPSAFARKMSKWGVVNLGAAGTFAVNSAASEKSLRAEFERRLDFETDLMICPASEILDLAKSEPFGRSAPKKGVKRYVSVLEAEPETLPRLPLSQPSGALWEVKVLSCSGRFVFSLHCRRGKGVLYPNAFVEKEFNLAATTRNWNTLQALAGILSS